MLQKPTILLILLICALGFYEWSTIYPTNQQLETYAIATTVNQHKPLPDNSFTQDGCTLFPNTLLWHDLRPACLQHDIAYWAGGNWLDKAEADLYFYNNIRRTGPLGPLLAHIMYSGVDHFGDSMITKLVGANWGYGNNE